MGTASSTVSLTRLTLPACNRPQASQRSQDLSPAESEKNAHRHFRKRSIDSRPPALGLRAGRSMLAQDKTTGSTIRARARESSHVAFAEPSEDDARWSCKKSMVHPSSP